MADVSDSEFLKRIVRAPWTPTYAELKTKASDLIMRNNDAIGLLPYLKEKNMSLWDQWNLDVFTESGWLDYFSSHKNIELGKRFKWPVPTVIDGVLYSSRNKGLTSLYQIKLYKIPGTIPYIFRHTSHGYDYLLSINVIQDSYIDVIRRRWGSVLDSIDFDMIGDLSDSEDELRKYVVKIGLDKVLADLLVSQASNLFAREIYAYEENFNLQVLTDAESGSQQVVAELEDASAPQEEVSDNLANQVLPLSNAPGTPSANLITLLSVVNKLAMRGYLPPNLRVQQYKVPNEVRAEDIEFIRDNSDPEGEVEEGIDPRSDYLDTLACLSSRGLIDELKRTGRKDFIKFFGEHVTSFMPYIRYGKTSFDPSLDHMAETWDFLESYQKQYNEKQDEKDYGDAVPSHPEFNKYDAKYGQEYVDPTNREEDIITSRIRDLVDEFHTSPVPPDAKIQITRSSIRWGEDWPGTVIHTTYMEEWAIANGKPSIKRMIEYFFELRRDYDLVSNLHPVIPFSHRITIHGVSFNSYDIVRLFHGTPIAGAAQHTDEYDPPWLSHSDVSVIKDFVEGRTLPYTYYMELSDEAHIHLSDEGTFIYMYSHKKEIDQFFILGERLVDYLARAKSPNKLSSKTKTLLSLF